jgi:hypothetical protein
MSRRIIVYGHGDMSTMGFPTPEALVQYLEGGIFQEKDGRYRYSQTKPADVVVLARDGKAYGHFEIDDAVAPSAADRKAYPPVKKVYLVRKSVRYANAVALAPLGISNASAATLMKTISRSCRRWPAIQKSLARAVTDEVSNQRQKLTGAAILVFELQRPCRRPRQVS